MKLNDFLTNFGIISAIGIGLYLIHFLISWIFTAMADRVLTNDLARNKDCYYLVPDPAVTEKEGETQWLRLQYKDVNDLGHHVSYEVNGVKYKTIMYIFCRPNNNHQ